jgi:hypothetical protein
MRQLMAIKPTLRQRAKPEAPQYEAIILRPAPNSNHQTGEKLTRPELLPRNRARAERGSAS